jgi:hypothetical protein
MSFLALGQILPRYRQDPARPMRAVGLPNKMSPFLALRSGRQGTTLAA